MIKMIAILKRKPGMTMEEFIDHYENVHAPMNKRCNNARLKALGIDLHALTEKLQQEGVEAFRASLDKLLATLDRKCHAIYA